jgi:hypothetical protein
VLVLAPVAVTLTAAEVPVTGTRRHSLIAITGSVSVQFWKVSVLRVPVILPALKCEWRVASNVVFKQVM